MQLKQSLFGCVVRLRCLAALFGSVVQLPGRRHIKSELPVLLAVPAGAGEVSDWMTGVVGFEDDAVLTGTIRLAISESGTAAAGVPCQACGCWYCAG